MSERTYDCGLLLLGHGSTDDPSAANAVFAAAGRLRGRFADVRVGLLKGTPTLEAAVAGMSSRPYVAVPFLMADGWFARTRLPTEIDTAVSALGSTSGARTIALTDPVGTSDAMAEVVEEVVEGASATGRPTGVLVVGHGTPRDPRSTAAVVECAARLRERGLGIPVETAFLDDRPSLAEWVATSALRDVVVVPYFAGAGPHASVDVPRELGLPEGFEFGVGYQVGPRRIRYLEPVGALPAIDRAIIERVDGALAR